MIRELSVRNVALIDDIQVHFRNGLSVFTGETGAGKSILVTAIGLLLGERASVELVRQGFAEALVTGVFELDSILPSLQPTLTECDIPVEEGTLIIRRTISRSGRNRIHANQVPIPLSSLRAIGDCLVDLHGQHEHQSLLHPETAFAIVNGLPDVGRTWSDYAESYTALTAASDKLSAHRKRAVELAEKRDYIEYQYRELADLRLISGQEEELNKEYSLLSSVTERLQCVSSINALIQGNDGSQSLERALAQIRKHLEALVKFDNNASPWIETLEGPLSYLGELGTFCDTYLHNDEASADPSRLDQINARLAKIQRIKKKYGCSSDDLLLREKELKEQLDSLENVDAEASDLEKTVREADAACRSRGKALTAARNRACSSFDSRITTEMARLGFSAGAWRTNLPPEKKICPHGLENITFEVRTNPGEPFLPLAKTASGGEISRLMLAVKAVLATNDRIPVLIFDEIDTGIGGHLAGSVGEALCSLKESHQVICISHLHQIAARADHHYLVSKVPDNGRTVIRVKELTGQEKVDEISRMLGDDSEIAREHAKDLLRHTAH